MANKGKQTESCVTCKWEAHNCDPVIKKLQGLDCPSYEKVPNKNLFTCFKCKDNETCSFSFDYYNLKGDCLAIK